MFIQGGRSLLTAGSPKELNQVMKPGITTGCSWLHLRCHENSKKVFISFLQVAKIPFDVFLHQVSWVETEVEINYGV